PLCHCTTARTRVFQCDPHPRDLHSFPTRRSSDLESYWQKTQFIKPRDRDVVCHASAWDMNMGGDDGKSPDVRTKMCIKPGEEDLDRKSTRLNSSHVKISYAVFCLKKKKKELEREH